MKLQLLLAGNYLSCQNTQQIWQEICDQHHLDLIVIEIEHAEGQVLAQQLKIKSFPALIIDNEVKAVGHPDKDSAKALIASLGK